ncbi:adrenomedullin a isoform X1 [Xiphophorus couchianus]|uniref:adrenomedullin a isoform X1 n=2 Tax=Xiphophorus couchianus TaxID=32473 RepID=UPI001016AD64|nr:ADM isoform X1 [Xiphophorus couchianus]
MKTIFHSFLYCCLLASVAHCVELEVNPELKKRLSMWLGSRLRRDLETVAVQKTAESENFVRPEDIRDTLLPHSSTDIKIRTKRSVGCTLGTCSVHVLAHRVQQFKDNKLKTSVPHGTDIKIRTKRSAGCALGTCSVHILAHRLQQTKDNKLKISAPASKMSAHGYGRRRRSIPERQISLRMEEGRLRPVWSLNNSQVHKLEALLSRT